MISPAIIPRARMCRRSRSRSGWSSGSPPLKATTELFSVARCSIRSSMTSVGTGWLTLSYSLQ